jgi:hypothetical protein
LAKSLKAIKRPHFPDGCPDILQIPVSSGELGVIWMVVMIWNVWIMFSSVVRGLSTPE